MACREHEDLKGLIGFFVNMIPLRNQLEGSYSFEKLLQQVKENTLEAYDHQMYPFEMLVNDLKLIRNPARNPLFDMVVTADVSAISKDDDPNDALTLNMFSSLDENRNLEVSKYDIRIRFLEVENEIRVNILFNKDLYKRERIEALGERLLELTKAVIADPMMQLDDYQLDDSLIEQQNIVADFNF